MIRIIIAAWFMVLPFFVGVARASDWLVCDYTIRTLRIHKGDGTIESVITETDKRNPDTCLAKDALLRFRPETPNFQNELPRRAWPRVQQQSQLRYRHLDGMCKADGQDRACRIAHYSIIRNL